MITRTRLTFVFVIAMAYGCGTQDGSTPAAGSTPPATGHHTTTAGDAGGTVVGSSSGGLVSPGDDASSPTSSEDTDATPNAPDAADTSEAGDDGPAPSQPEAAPPCVKGQVTPDEVVMLGDSYLDPAWGNVGPTLMMDANNAAYRHYYIGGAALAWGNPDTQFYIPYQFNPMALTDVAVTNPADIKVVILDGGGNDVLIGNTSCETTAPPANTSCVTTVQNAINEAQTEMTFMASKGVQQVVFFFYPHLDTAGGGILQTPAPAVNDTLDYAYPLAEQFCCGSSFTSSLTNYSCSGHPAPGLTCVFIDTRPSFEGHLSDYIKSDKVHPTQAGAQVIADLIWAQMHNHCIAQ
jgi:lysophospholipase L1-like esterase